MSEFEQMLTEFATATADRLAQMTLVMSRLEARIARLEARISLLELTTPTPQQIQQPLLRAVRPEYRTKAAERAAEDWWGL